MNQRHRRSLASAVVCSFFVAHASSNWNATIEPPRDAARQTARDESRSFAALLAALRAYEASLPDMAWEQTVQHIPKRDETQPERQTDTWSADMAFARDGRWRSTVRYRAQRDACYFDGNWIHARGVDANTRIVRAHETEAHQYLLSPLMLVTGGRDYGGVSPYLRMLSDELAGLQEVEVDDSADPFVRVVGSRQRGNKWEQLEVTLDAERGFMPTLVLVTDEESGVVRNEYRVSAAERVGPVWIPSEGTRKATTLQATKHLHALSTNAAEGAKVKKAFDAWRAANKLDLTKRADRARVRQKTASLAGGPLFEGEPLAGYDRVTLRAWNFRVLDDALAAQLLRPPFDEGDEVLDSRTREICHWRGGKLVKEDGTPVVLDAAPAKPDAPAPKPPAENTKP